MKKHKWVIETKNVVEKTGELSEQERIEAAHQEWCTKRCKQMLQDFFFDIQKGNVDNLSDLRNFIDKWVETHFQY